jgi:hypothetical protein
VRKLIAILLASMSVGASVSAIAAEEKKAEKKPSAEECKKNPKLKGCEKAK